ncbi:insulinase family protein [Paucibacter sp. KBW04]|nr:insulinase family protein [Paucibacter sp. KBW04]
MSLLAPALSLHAQAKPASHAGLAALHSVEGISEYRLPNGLQVLLAPDPSKPSTTVNMTYRVGSKHENYGETGMAHLLEHLIFKGSPRHPNPWAEFSRRGLNANGTTDLDRTNYFASFAAEPENLRWYLAWQADAMVNSLIARRDLDTEMTVVRNEMEIGENKPDNILFERTLAAMYQWHHYGKSVIGARVDVENVDIPRLQAFYRRYYQPDNATLIISGRFEPRQTLAWVQQSFGAIPAPKRQLPKFYTVDPAQDGERAVTVRRSGGVASLNVGYHVPAGPAPDYAAIELLKGVLSTPPAGRLHQRLVAEKKLAGNVSAFSMPLAEPGFLLLGAELQAGASASDLQDETLRVLEQELSSQPISTAELERARTRWLNHWEQQFADAEQVGLALSESVAQGDWRLFFQLRDRVKNLGLADLQRVAESYLRPANRTLARYIPTEQAQRAPAPALVQASQQLQDFKPGPAAPMVPPFEATPAEIHRLSQTDRLPGGLRLTLLPKPTRGGALQNMLSLQMGDAQSLQGQAAVAELAAALLDKGTQTLDRQALRDRMDALKIELQISASAERLNLAWSTRRPHAEAALALIAQMLRQPRFSADSLEEVRAQALGQLQAQRDDPEALAGNALNLVFDGGAAWPRGDARHARSFAEMEADLRAVTLAQVQDFQRRFYGAAQAQFAAVGDFDAPSLRQAAAQALGDWQAAQPYAPLSQPLRPLAGAESQLLTPDKQNAVFNARLALPVNEAHADYVALSLVNQILGGSSDSRLWKRVREREGLSYSVWSYLSWSEQDLNSSWHLGALFAPQNKAKVEQAFKQELELALSQGFSARELREAQQAMLSERRLARAQDPLLAATLAHNLFMGRDALRSKAVDEAIAKLSLEQLNSALRRYLKPDDFQRVWVGDFK